MSPAESIFYRNIFEVHSGADPVNFLAGYESSTLQILREDPDRSLLEWNRG